MEGEVDEDLLDNWLQVLKISCSLCLFPESPSLKLCVTDGDISTIVFHQCFSSLNSVFLQVKSN